MGFLSRRRKHHEDYIKRAVHGIADYRSNVRAGVADYGARVWDRYGAQITAAAVSYAAEAVGVSGQEALEFLGLGDLVDDQAVGSYVKTYDTLQDYGVIGDDPTVDTYIDYWYASNIPIYDSSWGAEFGAAAVGEYIGDEFFPSEDSGSSDTPGEISGEAAADYVMGLYDLPAPETPSGPDEDDEDEKKPKRRKWWTPRPTP